MKKIIIFLFFFVFLQLNYHERDAYKYTFFSPCYELKKQKKSFTLVILLLNCNEAFWLELEIDRILYSLFNSIKLE